jgi:hypothetical protein
MALNRKQWNNILIAACVFMVATLTLLQNKTDNMPAQTLPLFDEAAPLRQLQLDGIWLQKSATDWRCDEAVLNCTQWAQAWDSVRISQLDTHPTPTETPMELVILVRDLAASQVWLYFPSQGMLKSSGGNWYQIPPSLRATLLPVLDAQYQ